MTTYLLNDPYLTNDAANLYDGGWRDGDQEDLIQEYGITREYADKLCELFRYYDTQETQEVK